MSRIFILALLSLLAGCAARAPLQPLPESEYPPAAPREFRGAWVATVANIDWPSKPGLPAAQQRSEMLDLLDRASAIGLNAIVLQVRPAADALYLSKLEPWSEVLSGVQGQAPEPDYDPLAEWVEQAHRRGLELHAWFNPYRARHPSARSAPAALHISQTQPGLVRSYGDVQWLDPGEPAAAAHTLAVVADVVRRYDIDGAHIDDYFYPYPVTLPDGGELPFPDDVPWQRYLEGGGSLARDAWRRDNVNRLVEGLYDTVHRIKPGIKLGVSPFGIGRPELRPAGIEGFSQYDKLYADVELWIEKGWFDYLAPQLYWPIARTAQAFPVLADYWAGRMGGAGRVGGSADTGGRRQLWPGLFTSSVATGPRPWPAEEVLQQIELLRQRPEVGGHIHFSMAALMQDRDGLAAGLVAGPYRQGALMPAAPMPAAPTPAAPTPTAPTPTALTLAVGSPAAAGPLAVVPAAPGLAAVADGVTIQPAAGSQPFAWAVWRRAARQWRFAVQAANELAVQTAAADDAVVISAVSRSGQESPRVALRLSRPR